MKHWQTSCYLILFLIMSQSVSGSVWAQDAKAILKKAAAHNGGIEKLRKLSTFAVSITTGDVQQVHLIRVRNRMSYFRAVLPNKKRIEIVLALKNGFVVDRDDSGKVAKVKDLNPTEAAEAGYDRDLFLLPVLLAYFHDENNALAQAAGKSEKGNLLVDVTLPKAAGSSEYDVRYTLKFSSKTGQLVGANSVIPCGPNKGKTRRVVFANYKAIKELNLPRQIRYKIDGEPIRTVDFKLKLDAKIAATQFLKPKVDKDEGDSK